MTLDECLEHRVGMTTVVAVPTKDKPHFMVPFPRNEDFIGESYIASWFKAYRKERIAAGKSEHTGHLALHCVASGG
jgi:hypothetical protein